jgi:hypothetical protein
MDLAEGGTPTGYDDPYWDSQTERFRNPDGTFASEPDFFGDNE